jgi:hypothetical protein
MARQAGNGRLACQNNWEHHPLEIWVSVGDHRRMPAWSDWFEKRRLDIELRRRLRHLEERPGVAGPLSAWERLRQETLMEARNSLQTGPRIPWQVFRAIVKSCGLRLDMVARRSFWDWGLGRAPAFCECAWLVRYCGMA